jgi:hypothetical protein
VSILLIEENGADKLLLFLNEENSNAVWTGYHDAGHQLHPYPLSDERRTGAAANILGLAGQALVSHRRRCSRSACEQRSRHCWRPPQCGACAIADACGRAPLALTEQLQACAVEHEVRRAFIPGGRALTTGKAATAARQGRVVGYGQLDPEQA